MMGSMADERRRVPRQAADWPLILLSGDGREIATGKASDISSLGVFAMVQIPCSAQLGDYVVVELDVPPADPTGGARPLEPSKMRYGGHVVRTTQLGDLVGLGVEFVERRD